MACVAVCVLLDSHRQRADTWVEEVVDVTTSKNTLMLAIAVSVVVALLIGLGAGWLLRGGEVDRLEDQVVSLEKEVADLSAQVAADAAVAAPDEETDAVESEAAVNERQPGYVKSIVTADGVTTLTIDYIQFLTGTAAAEAATAHGDESPPPNDYYIVNDNPKLREFPVRPGITVTVVTFDDGTSDPDGHPMTLAAWAGALAGPQGPAFKAGPYWVTITDGTVTAIEAQYIP